MDQRPIVEIVMKSAVTLSQRVQCMQLTLNAGLVGLLGFGISGTCQFSGETNRPCCPFNPFITTFEEKHKIKLSKM